ncbi:DNA-binding transcription repressor [Coemansia sp. RSA 2336]|nr:DNA-binding transcription repressor [Coemansia sp. RSA 2336]
MAMTYDRASVAGRFRHKRKGIPRRSPCRRDMVEAPGVVFRFPDKISPGGRDMPGLAILPSAAGLPSGMGAKSAASVIAAAAAVSSGSTLLPTAAPTATAPTVPSAAAALPAATAPSTAGHAAAPCGADQPTIASTTSTPILRPAAVAIHRSASNVLHYPELLSDLRDRLIQAHQAASVSSGAESDSSRAKPRRAAKTAEAEDSPSRRSGLRGLSGSPESHSSVGLRARSDAKQFHRRHSIGTIQQPDDDDDEIVDIDDSSSSAARASEGRQNRPKRKREREPRRSQSPAKRPAPQPSGRRCCASCGASSTPCWRPGLIDRMTLCNLCGLRYKKGKVYCTSCSYVPTKTEIATGGASVCKRCSSPIHKQSYALDL